MQFGHRRSPARADHHYGLVHCIAYWWLVRNLGGLYAKQEGRPDYMAWINNTLSCGCRVEFQMVSTRLGCAVATRSICVPHQSVHWPGAHILGSGLCDGILPIVSDSVRGLGSELVSPRSAGLAQPERPLSFSLVVMTMALYFSGQQGGSHLRETDYTLLWFSGGAWA
jgi:hypothetical protein